MNRIALSLLLLLCLIPNGCQREENPTPAATPEEIEAQQAWQSFCRGLAEHARLRATLRDQGVEQGRHALTEDTDPKLASLLMEIEDFAYRSDEAPTLVAARIEILCRDHVNHLPEQGRRIP